jgi:transcriptional regulator with XRE-family HTH domain
MSESARIKFPSLSARIAQARIRAHLTQGALATNLGVKQQAVSRWEAGTHRPSVDQIPRLAAVIDEPASDLMTEAGYAAPVALNVPTLFPVDALDPATFEQFVAALVKEMYPAAEVRVQGAHGHVQAGTDVVARFPDKTKWSLQCKRVERFGRADIEKAVADHTVEADRKFLVLSRIASPGAADAMAEHEGWTLWDKQDLTQLVRRLPGDAQDRLVDIYFRGRRMTLLGRSEPGPWVTINQYFAPFKGRAAVFSHDWDLVGRSAEIDALVEALASTGEKRAALLLGPGGIGKTRVLKEAINRYAAEAPGVAVLFLSASREPDPASLDSLGNGHKLLVVDDGHDREGLGLVIEYAANPDNKARLIIASRPYAEQRIRNELAVVSIVDPPTVRLDRLESKDLRALVIEVLEQFDGQADWADSILAIASDNPLVAAMAARVVATEGLHSEFARGERALRDVILGKFTKVITGQLGLPADAPLLRSVLEVLAVIQPFHVDDGRVAALVSTVKTGIDESEVSRALKLLVEGGVIYKRGHLYRLMPDLLGDFLIEQSCVGADEKLTRFATTLAENVEPAQLTQVLVNLGRMDWRLAGGDPSDSHLLDPIWSALNAIDEKYDARIEAVQSAAYYQPAQAMAFVQAQIDAGRILQEFGTILRRVAYSPGHRLDALRLLWDLGQEDQRELNPHPNHPVRTLAELLSYERQKPLGFIEDVAEFAFGLIDEPGAWNHAYTPFNVLEPLLSGQGMSTYSTGRTIAFSPFFIEYKVVAHLRARLIDRTLELLESADKRIAHKAGQFLTNAVRAPYGAFNTSPSAELAALYDAEFKVTIERVAALVTAGKLASTTLLAVIGSLDWWAEYGDGEVGEAARAVMRSLPDDLDFRLYAALTDRADWQFVGQVPFDDWKSDGTWADAFVDELIAAFDTDALCDTLTVHLDALEAVGEPTGMNGNMIDRIIGKNPEFGPAIIARSHADPHCRLGNYLGCAVGALLDQSPDQGRALVATMIDSDEPRIRNGAARSLIGLRRTQTQGDVALLARVVGSEEAVLANIGITAVRTWRDVAEHDMVALALQVRFDLMPELLEPLGMLLCSRQTALLDRLQPADVEQLLARMALLPRLEGHWTGEILEHLAKRHTSLLADFLFARADRALDANRDEDFHAIGFSHRRGHLNFQDAPMVGEMLPRAWLWLHTHDQAPGRTRYKAAELFATMFKVDSNPVVEFLESMLDWATDADLRWMGDIMRHAHHSFTLQHRRFVVRLLERCKTVSRELLAEVIDELRAAALSGSWSGTAGEPMPRDLAARDRAEEILATMSRLSPAFPLYKSILDAAKRNIERSLREGQAMDDEE